MNRQRPRMHFDSTLGWVCDFHTALTPRELQAIANYMLKVQTDRMRAASGEKRKLIAFSVELLKRDGWRTVKMRVTSDTAETVLYEK